MKTSIRYVKVEIICNIILEKTEVYPLISMAQPIFNNKSYSNWLKQLQEGLKSTIYIIINEKATSITYNNSHAFLIIKKYIYNS